MKKLLWIRDSQKFWKVFSEERKKIGRQRRNLPFAKKIDILSSMQKLFHKNR